VNPYTPRLTLGLVGCGADSGPPGFMKEPGKTQQFSERLFDFRTILKTVVRLYVRTGCLNIRGPRL
jgi:hypothetical protein